MTDLQLSAPVASAALAHIRDSEFQITAPFAQPIMIVERARVAGTIRPADAEDLYGQLVQGTRLKLRREPSSRHDPFTIRVLNAKDELLGYIPADVNEILARLMDAGKHLYANVIEIDESGTWSKLYVEVYLDD